MIDLIVAAFLIVFLTWYQKRGDNCKQVLPINNDCQPDKNDNHVKVQAFAQEQKQDENHLQGTKLMQPKEVFHERSNGVKSRDGTAATNHSFHNADIVTFVSPMRICGAIFKNPEDKSTHFYRYRLRKIDDDCPLEIRNIGAAIKLWGQQWENFDNIKIFEVRASEIEEPTEWLSRLEDKQEDCQNKYGCRISLEDFEFINNIEKKVFKDLSKKIIDASMSEDDLIYFSGIDDSNIINKHYFDI